MIKEKDIPGILEKIYGKVSEVKLEYTHSDGGGFNFRLEFTHVPSAKNPCGRIVKLDSKKSWQDCFYQLIQREGDSVDRHKGRLEESQTDLRKMVDALSPYDQLCLDRRKREGNWSMRKEYGHNEKNGYTISVREADEGPSIITLHPKTEVGCPPPEKEPPTDYIISKLKRIEQKIDKLALKLL